MLYILKNIKTGHPLSGDRGHVYLFKTYNEAQERLDWGGDRLTFMTPKADWEVSPCKLVDENEKEICGPFMF